MIIQEDLINAIQTLNYPLFIDLGGSDTQNLNYCKYQGQSKIYPLLSAAAKGSPEMMRLVLSNQNLDINVKNEAGVNAFWISCMFGHGEVMNLLAQ